MSICNGQIKVVAKVAVAVGGFAVGVFASVVVNV